MLFLNVQWATDRSKLYVKWVYRIHRSSKIRWGDILYLKNLKGDQEAIPNFHFANPKYKPQNPTMNFCVVMVWTVNKLVITLDFLIYLNMVLLFPVKLHKYVFSKHRVVPQKSVCKQCVASISLPGFLGFQTWHVIRIYFLCIACILGLN